MRFSQVDVFTAVPLLGNPLAVIHDADGLTGQQMAAIARWTNLSETTFLTCPTVVGADYRVRIFTPSHELPFAGHPTIGSAHAWLDAGGVARREDVLVQECGVGLIEIRRGERLAFAAPPLLRSGPVEAKLLARIAAGLGVRDEQVLRAEWIDNGPGWVGVELASAEEVLAIEPDPVRLRGLQVGVVGHYPPGADRAVELRAFTSNGPQFSEDPVTGSLNAGVAQWLIGAGRLPSSYVAGQGARRQRDGRVHITVVDGQVWVGGDAITVVRGDLTL